MRRLGGVLLLAAGLSVVADVPVSAQQQAPAQVQPDPLFDAFFPPELIMQHQRAIGLTDQQRASISRLIQDLQSRVVQLQWDLLDEMQQLTTLMGAPRVDLDRALDQLDDVLELEKQIKQSHLEMLARIKNLLSPEQQAQLERLRSATPGA
jgi:Spy/CpxP family protein refolding chaperone